MQVSGYAVDKVVSVWQWFSFSHQLFLQKTKIFLVGKEKKENEEKLSQEQQQQHEKKYKKILEGVHSNWMMFIRKEK